MSTPNAKSKIVRREAWGRLRKLPSGRWQARYPGPDGKMYTARTGANKSLTFLTKTDARAWLAGVQSKIALGTWAPPEEYAERRRFEDEEAKARVIGFADYAERWLEMIRTEPNRSGKRRAVGTVRAYKSKVTGYLIPEFGDTPIREIDKARIRQMTLRLDQIPSPLNPKSKFNGVTTAVLVVLMMILRQAMRDGLVASLPDISIPKQPAVRHDAEHDPEEDVATPEQVEALFAAMEEPWSIGVLLAAWCQLRRAECLGLQRRDVEWHDEAHATAHVRRQLNANTGDYTLLKSDAGQRSVTVPSIMIERLRKHLAINVGPERNAPILPSRALGSVPMTNTRWGHLWGEVRDSVPGLPPRFRFHDLRHTGLTLFAQEGAMLAELMRRGGHSDLRVVLRYQHATMTRDRELAERMSSRIADRLAAAPKPEPTSVDSDAHL